MTTTTIKVSTETRDRLKAQAAAARLSLGEHLARLADAADRAARLEALGRAVAETPDTVLKEYAEEIDAWDAAELTRPR